MTGAHWLVAGGLAAAALVAACWLLERLRLAGAANGIMGAVLLAAAASFGLRGPGGTTAAGSGDVAAVRILLPASAKPGWASTGAERVLAMPDRPTAGAPAATPLPSPPPGAGAIAAALAGEVEAERAGHEETKAALKHAREAVAKIEDEVRGLGKDLAMTRTDLESERAAFATARNELIAIRGELGAAKEEIARLAGGQAARAAPFPAAPEDAEALRKARDELSVLTTELATTRAELGAERAAAKAARDEMARVGALAQPPTPQLSQAAVPAPATATQTAPPRPGRALRQTLDAGLRTPHFAIAPIADGIVEGAPGIYYRITLTNPADGKSFTFGKGDYRLAGAEAGVQAAFRALGEDVLGQLGPGASYQLYVEGKVTPQGFAKARQIEAQDEALKDVAYLPTGRVAGRYAKEAERQTLSSGLYHNANLAVLRAGYVSRLIERSSGGSVRPKVLAGRTTPTQDPGSRSFDLVLCVVGW